MLENLWHSPTRQCNNYLVTTLNIFSFYASSYSFLLSAFYHCSFCICSPFCSRIGTWSNAFNKLRIYFFITIYIKNTGMFCQHLQSVLSLNLKYVLKWIQKWGEEYQKGNLPFCVQCIQLRSAVGYHLHPQCGPVHCLLPVSLDTLQYWGFFECCSSSSRCIQRVSMVTDIPKL